MMGYAKHVQSRGPLHRQTTLDGA